MTLKDTFADNMIAEKSGCVICNKKPTVWMVRKKGYCYEHKAYAEDERRKITRIIDQKSGDIESSNKNLKNLLTARRSFRHTKRNRRGR